METAGPIRGGLKRGRRGYEGKFLMTGKRLAVAAAYCVLAAPGALAQKAPPVNAGPATAVPPSPPAVLVAPAAKNVQWPRLLPDKSPAETTPQTWTPQELEQAHTRCNALLKGLDAVVVPETPMREGSACGTPAPMKLISVGKSPQVALSPPPIVTCDMVATLARWLERDVQPLARKHLGAPVVRIETMSSYSCRNAYGRAHGRVSEHGKANAVDIGSFVTARGRAALVVADWGPTARQIAAQEAADQAAPTKAQSQARSRGEAQTPSQPGPAQVGPVQPSVVPAQGGLAQPGRSVAPTRPAAAAATTIVPLDLRPGVTIGIPGITLDVSGASDRSLSSFGLMAPSRLGGPKPPPAAAGPPVVAPDGKTDFLRAAHRSACKVFNTVLGPEANNAHLNHFHLDMAERVQHTKICD